MCAKTLTVWILAVVPAVGVVSPRGQSDTATGSEDVTFNNGDVTLAGTLTLPLSGGPHPAVVLISGSGRQDRDGAMKAVPGYRSFAIIAAHLARNGFAVLRYDDRGVGQSTGEYIKAEESDFIKDAQAAFLYLTSRQDIDVESVGLLGHSEGSMIAAIVAGNESRVAFVISMAGVAVDGYSVLLRQAKRQAQARGMNVEQVAAVMRQQRRMLDLVVAQKWEELRDAVYETALNHLHALPEDRKALLGDLESFAQRKAAGTVSTFQHPRYQFILRRDNAKDWARVSVPVLALFGELDVQVDAAQNKSALEETLARAGNDDLTTIVLPAANHLFLKSRTGSMSEYAGMEKEFVPGFLEAISDWLHRVVIAKNETKRTATEKDKQRTSP
ncbi:MAG: alpha/beta fold hydrolase [Phycisphaerales bacterium]|nr:MAG: alpha/beta fold hydrolase [Phycisphaerales bacterium]